jgi:very-short-patch-repair endonuclease
MKQENILARDLRKNSTPQELKLWQLLRNHQYHNLAFKRQHPIGNYIVDFICKEKWIIVEVDGGQHNNPEEIIKDKERTKFLESKGYLVIRFWNNEIDSNIEGVFRKMDEAFGFLN